IDYMLTVSVSVSAGAEAITSAIPALYGKQVIISLIIIFILMSMNLRGMSESANFLMVPVYLFVVVMTGMIIWGLYQVATGAIPYKATSFVGAAIPGVSMALIFRAFSSGS
ncbi:amino acid permease, partial [Lacticaseibacillus paracasei]